MKFFLKGLFSKCDQIRRKMCRFGLILLKKYIMENFILCTVKGIDTNNIKKMQNLYFNCLLLQESVNMY